MSSSLSLLLIGWVGAALGFVMFVSFVNFLMSWVLKAELGLKFDACVLVILTAIEPVIYQSVVTAEPFTLDWYHVLSITLPGFVFALIFILWINKNNE